MRGVRPGQTDIDDARTRAARARLAANKAASDAASALASAPTAADYHQYSLIDPEEDIDA
jgi:hypothetical protein